jgi:hypothetical protein
VDAVEEVEEAGLGAQVVKILGNAGKRRAGIEPEEAAGTGVAGAFEKVERFGNVAYPSMKGPDVESEAVPTVPLAKAVVQIFLVQTGNASLLIGPSDGIAFLPAVMTDD